MLRTLHPRWSWLADPTRVGRLPAAASRRQDAAARLAPRPGSGYARGRMRTLQDARWIGLAIAALASGCGGGADTLEHQLRSVQSELIRMRAEQAVLSDRLAAMERSTRDRRPSAAPPPTAAGRDRPSLDVVRLEPTAVVPPAEPAPALRPPKPEPAPPGVGGPAADPELDEPRTLLRSTPDGGVIVVTEPAPNGAPRKTAARPAPASSPRK